MNLLTLDPIVDALLEARASHPSANGAELAAEAVKLAISRESRRYGTERAAIQAELASISPPTEGSMDESLYSALVEKSMTETRECSSSANRNEVAHVKFLEQVAEGMPDVERLAGILLMDSDAFRWDVERLREVYKANKARADHADCTSSRPAKPQQFAYE